MQLATVAQLLLLTLSQGFSTFFICVPPLAIIFLICLPPISWFSYPYSVICIPWNFWHTLWNFLNTPWGTWGTRSELLLFYYIQFSNILCSFLDKRGQGFETLPGSGRSVDRLGCKNKGKIDQRKWFNYWVWSKHPFCHPTSFRWWRYDF